MIIPHRDEVLIRMYRCGICGKVYLAQTGRERFQCLAMHKPGTCCHCHETILTEEQLQGVECIVRSTSISASYPTVSSSW